MSDEAPTLDELRDCIQRNMDSKRAKELAELTASIEKSVEFRIVHANEVNAEKIKAIEARHAEAIKQARKEAYEDAARMVFENLGTTHFNFIMVHGRLLKKAKELCST